MDEDSKFLMQAEAPTQVTLTSQVPFASLRIHRALSKSCVVQGVSWRTVSDDVRYQREKHLRPHL
jgi:hypothetical protein